MKGTFHKSITIPVMLMVILGIYVAAICMINFFAPPSFYDSDMYTDIRYAMEVWKHQSVFPEGWVFGNQLYVVSTPVLAGLLYGLTGAPDFSMGLASTLMSAFVLLSFNWMLRPVIKSREARLAGTVLFLAMVLFFGDAWGTTSGWQLLFTMCSYYACYALTVFLAFGCYLRSDDLKSPGTVVVLVLTCFLSFGTGIQSLRQTAVMTLPLMVAEFLRMIQNAVLKKPLNRKSLTVTALISAANLLGLVTAQCLDLEQVEIIGEMNLTPFSAFLQNLWQSILLALSLVMNHDAVSMLLLAGILLICGVAVFGIVLLAVKRKDVKAVSLLGLLLLSVLAILAIDALTTLQVRSIYYFMVFPLIAFLVACYYSGGGKRSKAALLVFLAVLFVFSCTRELTEACVRIRDQKEESAYEISEYLMEEGYTTVYAAWNQGADVVIASDWALSAGFYEYQNDPFFYYKYLCNTDIFKVNAEECVYLFYGQENVLLGIEKAKTKDIEMTLLKYFPDCDVYLYTASENIMEAFW